MAEGGREVKGGWAEPAAMHSGAKSANHEHCISVGKLTTKTRNGSVEV